MVAEEDCRVACKSFPNGVAIKFRDFEALKKAS